MVPRKAKLIDFYLSTYCDLYKDVAEKLRVPCKESQRDIDTIRHRVDCEGISFLTKSLPLLGKALDKCLATHEPMTLPTSFKGKKRGTIPELFGYLFSRVITPEGYVSPQVDTAFLAEIRQLVYFLYKLEIPSTPLQEDELLRAFVDVDAGLEKDQLADQRMLDETADLIRDIFATFDPADIVPRHGPGAVATGERVHEKHVFSRIYTNIEAVYPFTEYYSYSLSAVADQCHQYENLELLETGTAKVVLVPKDSRGPRIISCEPLEYQWIQQGLGRAIQKHLQRSHITGGFVNFDDQTINASLALSSSKTKQWVTLDMKEASDRVSLWLVKELFQHTPRLLDALLATRSAYTKLPSGQVVHMKKFAPMGSCLCFPVESLVFWALAVISITHEYQRRDPNKSFWHHRRKAMRSVYVYGDDMIVRFQDYESVLTSLPTVGLLFNSAKCCTTGLFRESCGCDAYNGVDVTPLRLKKLWSFRRRIDANILIAYTAYSNAMYAKGYRRVAWLLASHVQRVLGELPITNRQLSFLSLIRPVSSTHPGSHKVRFNKELQRREIKAWALRSKDISVDPNDWSMVLRRFTSPSEWNEPGIFADTQRSRLHCVWSSLGN